MRKICKNVFILALLSANPAWASLGGTVVGESLAININVPMLSGIYKAERDTTVIPRAMARGEVIQENTDMKIYEIPKSMPVALRIEGDMAFLIPIVAPEERGVMPDTYIFALEDLAQSGLRFASEGDERELYAAYSIYETSQVAVGKCKTFVQRYFGVRWGGRCASQISSGDLARTGFFPASCASADLQVWGGGKGHNCGHVAWRSGGTWSSGDFVGNPGRGFYSKGCYSRSGGRGFNVRNAARVKTTGPSQNSGSIFGIWFGQQPVKHRRR